MVCYVQYDVHDAETTGYQIKHLKSSCVKQEQWWK